MNKTPETPDAPKEPGMEPTAASLVDSLDKEMERMAQELKAKFPNAREITEADKDVLESWVKDTQAIRTDEDLMTFLKHVMLDYIHDYGTFVNAIAVCALAAARWADRQEQGGITGAQASFIWWLFFQHWTGYDGPARMLRYEDMLYPQYAERFDKVLSPSTWKYLQDKAKKMLEEETHANAFVRAHWESLAAGTVPFGYKVRED